MRRILGPVVLVILAATSLWLLQHRGHTPAAPIPASSSSPTVGPPPTAATRTTSSTSSPTQEPTTGSSDRLVDPPGKPVGPTATSVPRDEAQAAQFTGYEQAAVAFMRDFARPARTVTATQWWANVKPHLAARTVGDYSGTDPQQVPFTKVTGPAAVVPTEAPSSLLMVVRVPTEAGDYLVEMETDEDGIHITRATPAAAGGGQ